MVQWNSVVWDVLRHHAYILALLPCDLHVFGLSLLCVTSSLACSLAVFYTFIYSNRKREVDILEKKLEHKCQQVDTVQAAKENLELKFEQLKNEQLVCVVQKSSHTWV